MGRPTGPRVVRSERLTPEVGDARLVHERRSAPRAREMSAGAPECMERDSQGRAAPFASREERATSGPGARRMPLLVGSERMPRGQDNSRIRETIVRAEVLRPDESILAYAGGATADLTRAGFDGEDRVPRRGRR
jgi:hypothetical protein